VAQLPHLGGRSVRPLAVLLSVPRFQEYSFPSWDPDTCRQGLKGWAMDRVERLFVALAVIGFLIVSVIWILLT
jgi:hypothetical protein